MKTLKNISVALCLLIVLPHVLCCIAYADTRPYTEPVIIALGDDKAITYTVERIKSFVSTAYLFSISNVEQFKLILQKSLGYVIYVGHGYPEGLMLGSSLLSWSEIENLIKESPSRTHFIAACYSSTLQVSNKFIFGFKGFVDVDEAAMWITALYYWFEKQPEKIPRIVKYFVDILTDKVRNPERNVLEFLGYTIKQVRGIWHVKYNDQYGYYVKYTHPDTYVHYTWIGVESNVALHGNNLDVGHIPKSVVDTYNLGAMLSAAVASAALAAWLGGWTGALVGAIVAAAGVIVSTFVDWYVKDELGAGWVWSQNVWNDWYGAGVDIKMGGFMWCRFGIVLWASWYLYPLWYGWRDLGIDGM
ncbi:MAG: hypothetical protein ACPLRY_04505 [Candidatus Bathyarchaeales archaeon]